MAIGGVDLNRTSYYYQNRVGVDNQGNPVYYDPKKAQKKHIFIDFKEGVTPEQREEIAKKIEAKIKQQEAIEKALKDHGRINPTKDKVFLDANGELTTWKPGIIADPKTQEENAAKARKTAAALAGTLIAAGLAFLFRGKIKTGAIKLAEAIKPFVKNTVTKGKDLVKKGFGMVKPALAKVTDTAKGLVTKGIELAAPAVKYVKHTAGKAVVYLKNLVK